VRYDVNNSPIPPPCRIFDADGIEYHKVFSCDDETGEIIQADLEDGRMLLDATRTEVRKKTVFGKPPLRFEPIKR
jgi:hypothetical protein